MDKQKFNIGDKVKVVNYAHLIFCNKKNYKEQSKLSARLQYKLDSYLFYGKEIQDSEIPKDLKFKDKPNNIIYEDGNNYNYDIRPELVGSIGIVKDISLTQEIYSYNIEGVGAWYNENQLELISKN